MPFSIKTQFFRRIPLGAYVTSLGVSLGVLTDLGDLWGMVMNNFKVTPKALGPWPLCEKFI